MSSDAQQVPQAWKAPQWTITDRLRKARESAGMTQAELADAIGIGLRTVSNYEKPDHPGERKRPFVAQWALATGTWIDWLWDGVEPPEEGPDGGSTLGNRPSAWDGCVVDLAARRSGSHAGIARAA